MAKGNDMRRAVGLMVMGAICLAFTGSAALANKATEYDAIAHETEPGIIDVSTGHSQGQIAVPLNKSQLLRFDYPFRQITVGSKDIIQVIPLSHNTVYVLGRKWGSTNITLQGAGNRILSVIDIAVTADIAGLQERIHELMPEEKIDIHPAGDALVLSGQVQSMDHLRQIAAIADRYAPGAVTNLLTISGSQQVMLEVKFAEVQRNALKDLGVNFGDATHPGFTYNGGRYSLEGNSGTGVPSTAFGVLTGMFASGRYTLNVTLDALEQKGVVRTLAEPNLVALSGDTASFLAGGEFPIPVVQSTNGTVPTTTVEFKQFGVSLAFTPTIVTRSLVNLEVSSEVSAIDPSVSVDQNGIKIPGLKVRRAKTTAELNDGQSFAIAGLLQDDFKDGISQIPGLGDIPVLGALFRSNNYEHNQTELVVFITVHLVQPGDGRALLSSTDTSRPPSQGEFFSLGKTEDLAPPAPSGPPMPPPPPPATPKDLNLNQTPGYQLP